MTSAGHMLVRALGFAIACSLLMTPASAPAQSAATPFLPADHWAVHEVRRIAAAGLAPLGFDPGVRSFRIGEVARVFEHAATADAPFAPRAADYAARFAEEFGRLAGPEDWRHAAAATAGLESLDGEVLTGIGYSNLDDWTGTVRLPDQTDAFGRVWGAAGTGPVAVGIGVRTGARGADFDDSQIVLEAGAVGLWAGRRTVGYGPGHGGGIVLGSDVPLDGGGLFLTRPVRLPWILRHLGPVGFEMFGSRATNGDRVRRPWFWAARASIAPHERLTIGFNRGAMFGGEGNAPVTARNLFYLLVGEHGGEEGEFANQVMSVDARWRLPIAAPVEAYVEWGFDDTSGGYHRSPGVTAGLYLAALPGAPNAAFGVERTSFAPASFKNTIWYRNWSLRGGWTHDRRPMGHPLAGHGTEWRAHGGADFAAARVRLQGSLTLRDRGEENLLAPERVGRSTEAALSASVRPGRWLELATDARYEDGGGDWNTSSVIIALRAWLPGPGGSKTGAGAMTRRSGAPSWTR